MTRMLHRITVGFILLAITIGAALTAPISAQAIIGGTDDPHPWVVRVSGLKADGVREISTGFLIAPQWVVTTAHGALNPIESYTVRTSSGSPINNDVTVDRIDIPDGYDRTKPGTERDVAIIHLTKPMFSDMTYPRLGSLVSDGAAKTVGYGKTTDGTLPQGPRSAIVRVTSTAYWTVVTQGATGQGTYGDSGGPLIQNGVVVGIDRSYQVDYMKADPTYATNPSSLKELSPVGPFVDWFATVMGVTPDSLRAETTQKTLSGLSLMNGFQFFGEHKDGALVSGTLTDKATGTFSLIVDEANGVLLKSDASSRCLNMDQRAGNLFAEMSRCDATSGWQKLELAYVGTVYQNIVAADGHTTQVAVPRVKLRSAVWQECVATQPLFTATRGSFTLEDCDATSTVTWTILSADAARQQEVTDTIRALSAAREASHIRIPRDPQTSGPTVVALTDQLVASGSRASFVAAVPGSTTVQWYTRCPSCSTESDWRPYSAGRPDASGQASVTFIASPDTDGLQIKAVFTTRSGVVFGGIGVLRVKNYPITPTLTFNAPSYSSAGPVLQGVKISVRKESIPLVNIPVTATLAGGYTFPGGTMTFTGSPDSNGDIALPAISIPVLGGTGTVSAAAAGASTISAGLTATPLIGTLTTGVNSSKGSGFGTVTVARSLLQSTTRLAIFADSTLIAQTYAGKVSNATSTAGPNDTVTLTFPAPAASVVRVGIAANPADTSPRLTGTTIYRSAYVTDIPFSAGFDGRRHIVVAIPSALANAKSRIVIRVNGTYVGETYASTVYYLTTFWRTSATTAMITKDTYPIGATLDVQLVSGTPGQPAVTSDTLFHATLTG